MALIQSDDVSIRGELDTKPDAKCEWGQYKDHVQTLQEDGLLKA